MSKKKSPQLVTIDEVEYDANSFNAQQVLLLNHCVDLDRKINSTQFQLQQLDVSKKAFVELLKKELGQATS